jgi:hypothetical protein
MTFSYELGRPFLHFVKNHPAKVFLPVRGSDFGTGNCPSAISFRLNRGFLQRGGEPACELGNRFLRRLRRVDLANTVYALDSTTIDLCLSLFPWADFRSTKAAVKMHTLLDLRGPIPSFIHISDGKMGDAAALDLIVPEAGAIYVMDRGYVDFRRLHTLHQADAFFVTRTKINMNYHRV